MIATTMYRHFKEVAGIYNEVRTTDEAPVRFIAERLQGISPLRGADVGCGGGRYDLLLYRHLPGLSLLGVDINPAMLKEAETYLRSHGVENFTTQCAGVEDMALPGGLDVVLTFNAIHHFPLALFLEKAAGALKEGGRLFIYTRTPEQNARTLYGRYFPGFAEKETRLYPEEALEEAIAATPGLALLGTKTFRYAREASLERVLEKVKSRHYSTFSLYDEGDFQRALAAFEARLLADFPDRTITWTDENLLLEAERD
ncbi:MAG: class I SAM-dependent methyltransferase [Gammaproteobacteria bacterium]|nr:MAG: class I SAM-dependent methyltransferase [Gammaproteobacteria bacterium]